MNEEINTTASLTLHCDACGRECFPPADSEIEEASKHLPPEIARNAGFDNGVFCTQCLWHKTLREQKTEILRFHCDQCGADMPPPSDEDMARSNKYLSPEERSSLGFHKVYCSQKCRKIGEAE